MAEPASVNVTVPTILRTKRRLRVLSLAMGEYDGPPDLGIPAKKRMLKVFNPSLIAAPSGLCPRCAFVAAVRVDALHQCDESSPLFTFPSSRKIATGAFFKGTAIVVFDSQLRVLRWTWFLSQPNKQVATWNATSPRMYVRPGVADAYRPPWAQQVYDARLLNLDGRHLFITYNCVACKFSVSLLHLTRDITPDGGLRMLRAWASHRTKVLDNWMQGRNQAIFASPTPSPALLVQPWVSVVAALGVPRFLRSSPKCYGPEYEMWRIGDKRAHRLICGPSPRQSTIAIDVVSNVNRGFGTARVLTAGESSASEEDRRTLPQRAQMMASKLEKGMPLGWINGGGSRISTTANLELIMRPSHNSGRHCAAMLGIAHVHHADGPQTWDKRKRPLHGSTWRRRPAFKFGSQYMHYFYTVAPTAPHRVIGYTSGFCLASDQDPSDCESVQFITGLSLAIRARRSGALRPVLPGYAGRAPNATEQLRLLLSYGVNDCEAKLADVSLSRVWSMLRPVVPGGAVCEQV